MKIFVEDPSEYDLKGMLWSGAEKTLEEIVDADMYDNFVQYIDDVYYDGIDLTHLNDILRFDSEQLKKDIGMVSWDELSDLCDSKLIEDGIEEVESFIENLDEEDSSYEKDKEDAELTLNALEHLEGEIDKSVKDEEITEYLTVIIPTLDGYSSWMLENKKLISMISDIASWISDHNV